MDDLLRRIKNGNEEAFREAVLKYRGIAYLFIERYCLLYPNILERNELYQLSLYSLYDSILKYDEKRGTAFSTFYSMMFEHSILMHLRMISTDKSRLNMNAVSLDSCIAETEGLYLLDSVEDTREEFDPKKQNDIHLLYEHIEKELHVFSSRDKEIFMMWIQGYSYKEIAEHFDVSSRSIEYTVRKIRKYIQPSLREWR